MNITFRPYLQNMGNYAPPPLPIKHNKLAQSYFVCLQEAIIISPQYQLVTAILGYAEVVYPRLL